MRSHRAPAVVEEITDIHDPDENDNPFAVTADDKAHFETDLGGLYTRPDEAIERVENPN